MRSAGQRFTIAHGALRGVSLLAALWGLLAVSCGGDAPMISGGGSDLPNGNVAFVSGMVFAADSGAAAGAEVYLRSVVITGRGDSIVWEQRALTGSTGAYAFDSVPEGNYVVYCRSNDERQTGLDQGITVSAGRDNHLEDVYLGPSVDLAGHLTLPQGMLLRSIRIFIPGTGIGLAVNTITRNVHYVINKAPVGLYDIAFVYGDAANFSAVKVRGTAAGVAYLHDISLTMLDITADSSPAPFAATVQRSFCVSPVSYSPGNEPPWYAAVDFSDVDHYRHQDGGRWPWIDDPMSNTNRPYDTILAGAVWRESEGVVLQTGREGFVKLEGGILDSVTTTPRFSVVAARRRQGAGPPVYDAVEVEIYPNVDDWDDDMPGKRS
jgi:hypothetical protein